MKDKDKTIEIDFNKIKTLGDFEVLLDKLGFVVRLSATDLKKDLKDYLKDVV